LKIFKGKIPEKPYPQNWPITCKKCGDVIEIAPEMQMAFQKGQQSILSQMVDVGATIVCLCGSGRFKEAFEKAEFDETLKGNIVLTIGCNTHDIARTDELKHHKPMLDELHLRKIDLADEVLILNVGGYIGESTMRELQYAIKQGKVIRSLEPFEQFIKEQEEKDGKSSSNLV
jgi:hypothetical protein